MYIPYSTPNAAKLMTTRKGSLQDPRTTQGFGYAHTTGLLRLIRFNIQIETFIWRSTLLY